MDEKTPTVSVIIPTYNRAHLVGRAIQSVLDQTYHDFELIVVDDASTDATEEAVRNFNDPRIRYIRHEHNRGGSAARNTGIGAAHGEYIAFLDSDDEWFPTKLERQIRVALGSGESVGLVYTGIRYVAADKRLNRDEMPHHNGMLFRQLLRRNVVGTTSCALVSHSCLEEVGLFDENMPARQDLDLWLRISKKCRIDFVPEILTVHHIHDARITADVQARIRAYELLMKKHAADFHSDPTAARHQVYRLALLYLESGDAVKSRSLLWKSFRIAKLPPLKPLLSWILLGVGEGTFRRVRYAKRTLVTKTRLRSICGQRRRPQ
jgi:glycosyltransferase involved in cell wall biosynthesis